MSLGKGGEDRFVEAEDEGCFNMGRSSSVDAAYQDLIRAWRNDTDREMGQTSFKNGEPIAKTTMRVREGQFDIVGP